MKTLWSGVSYAAGTFAKDWDGTDESGRLAADGSYQIRVLSSRATYTWEGVVGNTSDAWIGDTVFHFQSTISGMAIAATSPPTVYIAAGYNEGNTSQARFSTTTPGKKDGHPGQRGGRLQGGHRRDECVLGGRRFQPHQ